MSYRIRLFLGRQCVFTIPAKELRGKTEQDVKATAAAAAAAYDEMRRSGDRIETTIPATPAATSTRGRRFSYPEAKERFFNATETDIGANRRAEIGAHFRQSVEPFFLAKHNNADPEQWPAIFDLFKTWLMQGRRRLDSRPGHIKARTANCHIASLNKFLRFCREVYGLSVSSNCKRFGRKVIDRESRANGGNGVTPLHTVWTEDEFVEFRKVAYALNPQLAPAYDLCFGLGMRRGEAIALRVGCVHLDDTQMGPLGYVEVSQQYTEELATGQAVLKLPKWEKTRSVPIPYQWLHDALQERISTVGVLPPRENAEGLRYVAQRYRNTLISTAMKVSECTVRNWLKRCDIVRTMRPPSMAVTEDILRDIQEHLLSGRRSGGPDDYLLADDRGRLPWPRHVGATFQRIIKQADVRRIRVHDLRHSFGSIWAQRVSVSVLKGMMGHASVTTTERYIHVTGEMFRLSITEALADIQHEKEDES